MTKQTSLVKSKKINRIVGAAADKLVESDGVDFINIYSGSKSRLGRLLSHFANTPIEHPRFGYFKTLEGLYYWLIAVVKDERLRHLDGWEAKSYGKTLEAEQVPNLVALMEEANRLKITQHDYIREMLLATELPFKHFYSFGKRKGKYVVFESEGDWLVDIYTRLREELWDERRKNLE